MHEPTEKDNEEIAVKEARRSLFAFFRLFTRCMSLLTIGKLRLCSPVYGYNYISTWCGSKRYRKHCSYRPTILNSQSIHLFEVAIQIGHYDGDKTA